MQGCKGSLIKVLRRGNGDGRFMNETQNDPVCVKGDDTGIGKTGFVVKGSKGKRSRYLETFLYNFIFEETLPYSSTTVTL